MESFLRVWNSKNEVLDVAPSDVRVGKPKTPCHSVRHTTDCGCLLSAKRTQLQHSAMVPLYRLGVDTPAGTKDHQTLRGSALRKEASVDSVFFRLLGHFSFSVGYKNQINPTKNLAWGTFVAMDLLGPGR